MRDVHLKKKSSGDYIGYFRRKPFVWTLLVILCAVLYFGLPFVFKTSYQAASPVQAVFPVSVKEKKPSVPEESPVRHLPTPKAQKAIYMTSCVAGTPSFRDELVQLVEETELNSIIIDIKDFSGTLSFYTKSEALQEDR